MSSKAKPTAEASHPCENVAVLDKWQTSLYYDYDDKRRAGREVTGRHRNQLAVLLAERTTGHRDLDSMSKLIDGRHTSPTTSAIAKRRWHFKLALKNDVGNVLKINFLDLENRQLFI